MIRSTTRFITLLSLFLIPIFALIVVNSYFFPFISGKGFYFRSLVEIAFASWVILAFVDASYRPRMTPLLKAVTIFALIALVADLLGVNPVRSFWSNFERMEGWITIAHLWMFFVVSSSMFGSPLEHKVGWKDWFMVWLGVAFTTAVYGLLQEAGALNIHQGSVRLDASLGNSAYMAVYMLISIGIALYIFFEQKIRWTKTIKYDTLWKYWLTIFFSVIVLLVLLLPADSKEVSSFFHLIGQSFANHWFLSTLGLILTILGLLYPHYALPVLFAYIVFETQTRGTILGLAGGIVLALFLYVILGKNEPKKHRMAAGGVIAFLVLLAIVFWFNRGSSFVQSNPTLQRLATISLHETQTQARAYIWPMALKGFTQRPVLGWGQENFNYVFNANYNPKMWTQEQWFDRAHSVYLDWLVASGIVGLLAYLALYVLAFTFIWKSKLSLLEKCMFTGVIAGYMVHNIFVFDNLASYIGFFAILSFISSVLHKTGKDGKRGELPSDVILSKKTLNPEVVEYVVVPATIVLFVLVFYFLNYRGVVASTRLIGALISCQSQNPDPAAFQKVFDVNLYMANQEAREQILSCTNQYALSNPNVPANNKQLMFNAAVQAINDQISITPKDARMYVIGGQFLMGSSQVQTALPILEKAHVLSPGKQVVNFELANAYINSGKVPEGLKLLKEAYEADPTYPQAQTGYAMGLVIAGQEAEARRIFKNDPKLFETEQAAQVFASPLIKKYSQAIAIYKKLVAASPEDYSLKARMAQVQYQAGMPNEAIATMRSIEKDHPEFKDQIEAAIKQIGQ